MHPNVWWAKLRERSHIEKDGVDGRRILKRIFKNQGAWSGLLRMRTSCGFCEHCNELRTPLCAGNFWNN
jgi:hypothetical protein